MRPRCGCGARCRCSTPSCGLVSAAWRSGCRAGPSAVRAPAGSWHHDATGHTGPVRRGGKDSAAALPGFRRVTRPILLSPEQGADTIVWLATAPHARLGSGRFWHDRRARPEHPLSWTREKDPAAARKLWDHLAAATATDSPKLAQTGRDSVADEQDIPAQGQR